MNKLDYREQLTIWNNEDDGVTGVVFCFKNKKDKSRFESISKVMTVTRYVRK